MEHHQTHESIDINGTVFDSALTENLPEITNWEEISQVLKKSKWSISYQQFFSKNWNKVFPFIIIASCHQFYLDCSQYSKIIMEISRPEFINLEELHLGQNKISSIEQLQFLNMPVLKKLVLIENKITQFNALKKCTWSSLFYLDLAYNPSQQLRIERLNISMIFDDKSNQKRAIYLGIEDVGQNAYELSKLNFNSVCWGDHLNANPKSRFRQCLQRRIESSDQQ